MVGTTARTSVLALLLVMVMAVPAFGQPSAAGAGVPSVASETDLKQACDGHRTEAARQRGWARTRFEQCHRYEEFLTLLNRSTGQPVGHYEFTLWVLAFAYDGSRRVDYTILAEDARQSSQLADDLTSLTITFTGCSTQPSVSCTGAQQRSDTIENWWRQPRMETITVTSPDDAGVDPFKIVNFDGWVGEVAEYNNGVTVPYVNSTRAVNKVRFDSAGSALGNGKFKGTVFTDHTPTLELPMTGADIDEEARHVDDALHHAERTFPSRLGKTVPGETTPLHRLMDSTKREQNHTASVKICKDVWGDNYTAGGQECDEYPFQSTYEGSSTSTSGQPSLWAGSARPINGDHNGKGGTKLANFYGLNRILDNDAFLVKILP